jgi:hypothetical protein
VGISVCQCVPGPSPLTNMMQDEIYFLCLFYQMHIKKEFQKITNELAEARLLNQNKTERIGELNDFIENAAFRPAT